MNLFLERWKSLRSERIAVDEGPRVSYQSRHVPDQLVRSAHLVARGEIRKVWRRSSQRFLRPIRKRGEKMLQKSSRFSHLFGSSAHAPSIARSACVIPVLFPGGIVLVT